MRWSYRPALVVLLALAAGCDDSSSSACAADSNLCVEIFIGGEADCNGLYFPDAACPAGALGGCHQDLLPDEQVREIQWWYESATLKTAEDVQAMCDERGLTYV